MALITTKALEAPHGTHDGKRLPDGGSMFGMVRATRDTKNHVSVDFQWRYKAGRQNPAMATARPAPHRRERHGRTGRAAGVIEKCLNHTEENKMTRIYQRATYEGPMHDAWRLWGERLDLLTDKPAKVVTLRAA